MIASLTEFGFRLRRFILLVQMKGAIFIAITAAEATETIEIMRLGFIST